MKKIEKIDKYKMAHKDEFAALVLFDDIFNKINEIIDRLNKLASSPHKR